MQEKVYQFLNKSGTITTPLVRLADVNSELGELSKEVLKETNYGAKKYDLPNEAIATEYGDLLYSTIALGIELGLNLEDCLELVLKKYNNRLEKKGHIGSK